jgi:hypothetical protein
MVVVLTLALGIGANTAIFSVVRGVVLKPLPHRDGDRLVYLRHSMDGAGGENVLFSVPEVKDFRDGARSLGGIAEYSPFTFTLRGENDAVRVRAGLVTGNFFEVMGLSPMLGRVTQPADDGWCASGHGAHTRVLAQALPWRFSRCRDAGEMEGKSVTVIGAGAGAVFPDRVDAFLNMVISDHHVSAMMVQGVRIA